MKNDEKHAVGQSAGITCCAADDDDLPDWTFRGGHFRSGFSTNDVPTKWTQKRGRWKRDELVPYGKATPEYRTQFYVCPECAPASLKPSDAQYEFVCEQCETQFKWSFGGLSEKLDTENRYVPGDY